MMPSPLSSNTQAILLLTAPLIAGKSSGTAADLLSHADYRKLARRLHEMQLEPANLLDPNIEALSSISKGIVEEGRLRRLLERGFLLSQVVDRWHARSIWVVSRADTCYPRRLRSRLREDAPALLYGCGQMDLLDRGGLAIVGSRHVSDELIESTIAIGWLTASAGKTVVSGGAKGIDQAAMHGALEAGGNVIGVLADSLERTALKREYREGLSDGKLVLISPFDPNAGFNVGHAMQRNKVVYSLADVSLVMNSDFNRGGTWAGAVEQLGYGTIPIYVRSKGSMSEGLDALRQRGALPWPNPTSIETLNIVFNQVQSSNGSRNQTGSLFDSPSDKVHSIEPRPSNGQIAESTDRHLLEDEIPKEIEDGGEDAVETLEMRNGTRDKVVPTQDCTIQPELQADEVLFTTVRQVIQKLLSEPKKDTEVASILKVSPVQIRAWLARLVDEEVIVKQKKPVGYVAKESPLFKATPNEG